MAANSGKARREAALVRPAPKVLPKQLPKRAPAARAGARTEILDKGVRARLEEELDAALKRRPASEVRLAGALRALAPLSPSLRNAMADAAQVLVRRGSFDRELYVACLRSLAEADDRRVAALLVPALASDDAGGMATLSAACFCRDPSLAPILAKLAASPRAHVAFGAEIARVCRRESNGAHLASLAPMIKESHRIALCVDFFVPLARLASVPVHVASGLSVLRSAERHLGRWLVLGEVAVRAGDAEPLAHARSGAEAGPSSARVAWSLVAWALDRTRAASDGAPVPAPTARPTVELVARLSDRPSADRDMTFLFRLADAGVPSAKAMLESAAKGDALADEVAVRAAAYLARDHGQHAMKDALAACARTAKRDELRGLAVAALWDTGDGDARAVAQELTGELVRSRCPTSLAWGAVVRAAGTMSENVPEASRVGPRTGEAANHAAVGTSGIGGISTARPDVRTSPTSGASHRVVHETRLRWLQWGWLE